MFQNIFNSLKKTSQRLNKLYVMFFCSLLYAPFAFANFNTVASNIKEHLKNTATTVLDVLNTVIGSIGVIYVIVIGFIFVFKPDTFKENSKLLIGALVALGALYGITKLGMSAFMN